MRLLIAIIATLSASFGSSAYAQFTIYGEATRDQFFSDAGGLDNITTINFTDLPNATTVTDQYSDLGVTFEGLNFTTGPFNNYHDQWGINIFSGNHLYFDNPINWIAADFLGGLRIEIYSGETFLHRFQRPMPERFVGGYSEIPFDHVHVYDPTDSLTVIDDLHFGPPIVVPAPGVAAALTLALFTVSRRRRR